MIQIKMMKTLIMMMIIIISHTKSSRSSRGSRGGLPLQSTVIQVQLLQETVKLITPPEGSRTQNRRWRPVGS